MEKSQIDINNLSSSQQVVLWIILHFKQKSFLSSEVTKSKFFTEEGGKAIGGILGALYRNGFIEKISGGRDKLWRLNDEIEKNKECYKDQLFKVKAYWR